VIFLLICAADTQMVAGIVADGLVNGAVIHRTAGIQGRPGAPLSATVAFAG